MPHPPRALFFDAAGTLIEVAEPVGAVYARHFSAVGIPCSAPEVNAAFRETFKRTKAPAFQPTVAGDQSERLWWQAVVAEVLALSHPDGRDYAESTGFEALFDQLFHHYATADAWQVFPDVLPTLERARAHARLLVVSNFDDRLETILSGLGLAGYFHAIVTSSQAKARKPAPGIFRHALDAAGVTPAEAAHVGDCPRADREGAEACGIRGFLVARPQNSLPDFLDFCGIGAK